MRRVLSAFLLTIMTATVLAVALPGPAQAADGDYPGVAGYLNLFDDTNYEDTWFYFYGGYPVLGHFGFNDKTSSYVNKTDYYWLLFDDTNYEDRAICLRPHSHYSNLGSAGFNDKTSSVWKGSTSINTCGAWPLIGITN
jgi:hypothetical protein